MRIFLACLFLMISLPTHAQEPPEKSWPTIKPAWDVLKQTGSGIVTNVIDGLRLQLHDGSIIHLSGLDIPDLYQPEPGKYAVAAQNLLEDLFLNQKVNLYQTPNPNQGRTNRMGHRMTHVTRADNDLWAQGALIAQGLARVRTTGDNHALAPEMLALEKTARENIPEVAEGEPASPYLWREDKYAILNLETVEHANRESFQIVEGKILKVASRNNVVFLNFGQNWRNDFTVSIPSDVRKDFSRAGANPLQWSGRYIRVRGWLDDYNGPHIEVDHPERIEFIEPEDTEEAKGKFAVPPLDKEIIKNALPDIKQPQYRQ